MVATAARQHNVIGHDELLRLGLGWTAITSRRASGWLNELFPGAYSVGRGNLTRRSYWKAATILCGPGSALASRSAAQLSRLADLIAGPPHVLIRHGRSVKRQGIVIHRSRDLPPSQVTRLHGIPVTTVARTLVDFAAVASPGELRNAVWAAARLEVLDLHGALRLCNESRGRTGTGLLRRLLLEKRGPVTETRSPLEDLFLPICADFGIRMPLVSVPVLNYVVDFLWLPERLVVELDGWEWHKSRESFEDDRRRDARLGVAGYHVHRATRGRLLGEPKVIAREVLAMLDRLAQSRTAAG